MMQFSTAMQRRRSAVTQTALAVGALPMDLISESMVPAMDEVGRLFEAEEYFVPELLLAGRAMKARWSCFARFWSLPDKSCPSAW